MKRCEATQIREFRWWSISSRIDSAVSAPLDALRNFREIGSSFFRGIERLPHGACKQSAITIDGFERGKYVIYSVQDRHLGKLI